MINLEDYFQTGEGGTALTYNHKDGKTLAKLFMKGYGAETSEREFLISRVVYETGLPTPKPIRLVTDGERYGAEYELIPQKRSFTRIISQQPDTLEDLSRRFAVLSRRIHETPADTERLPDMVELVRFWISRYDALPDGFKERFLAFLDTVPHTPTCLHGDLHIGNIITDGTRDLWIDVGDFAYGAPEWDLGLMYFITNFMSPQRADSIFHLDNATLAAHWNVFAKEYYGTDSKEELDAQIRKLYPYAAAKLCFVTAKISDGKGSVSEGLLNLFDRFLKF